MHFILHTAYRAYAEGEGVTDGGVRTPPQLRSSLVFHLFCAKF